MRNYVLFLALFGAVGGGCGAPLSTTLSPKAQEALCTPLAQQAAGDFACRESQLASTHANSGKTLYYGATVEFGPNGKVAKFRKLRALVGVTASPLSVPDCVAGTLQRLRVAERPEAVRLPIALTYTEGASPGAQLRPDGTCTIIVPPLPQ